MAVLMDAVTDVQGLFISRGISNKIMEMCCLWLCNK